MEVLKMRFKIGLFLILFSIPAAAAEKVVVKHIVDGDTISVFSGGKILKIRLIGIDTPESKENDKALRDSNRSGNDIETIISQGKQATAFIKTLLQEGDAVTLKFDIVKQDKYGRTLAYVYLSDGIFLNDLMISSGYAYPLTIAPNVKYKDLFLKSFQTAREKKIGLWAE
jgi:micrococcal nuclease